MASICSATVQSGSHRAAGSGYGLSPATLPKLSARFSRAACVRCGTAAAAARFTLGSQRAARSTPLPAPSSPLSPAPFFAAHRFHRVALCYAACGARLPSSTTAAHRLSLDPSAFSRPLLPLALAGVTTPFAPCRLSSPRALSRCVLGTLDPLQVVHYS